MRALAVWIVAAVACVQPTLSAAIGPDKVAKVEANLWPEKINTQALFNKASRASNLVYLRNLLSMKSMSDADLLSAFKINSVNRLSVDKWLNTEVHLTLNNYRLASTTCETADWTCQNLQNNAENFLSTADIWLSKIPSIYSAWQHNMSAFTQAYIAEQMRLAALFPKVTSEIDTFHNKEWTGSSLVDGEFYLTFDDGPTKHLGSTDDTLKTLREHKKSGTFFVLGEQFQARIAATSPLAVKTLYENQCVALHGWEHQSHAKWDKWQDSIIRTHNLVTNTIHEAYALPLFRPPYGQRKADSADFFNAHQLRVALWNIDSQDWNSQVDASTVKSRIIALMLIKRHGVILFHDTHAKSKTALPSLFEDLGNAVVWGDCRRLAHL